MALIHDEIRQVLKRWVTERGVAPGAAAYVARFDGSNWRSAEGAAGVHSGPGSAEVTPATLYDLASLTKPVIACTLARLARAQRLGWEAPLGELLPAVVGSASAALPLRLFASHRAGLLAHVRLRDSGVAREDWLGLCASGRRAECQTAPPDHGFPPLYSDLGYILIGALLERLGGAESLVQAEVVAPHGLELDSARGWERRLGASAFLERVAPTEIVADRGGLIRGAVHDDNAWDLQGTGLAGHAGLFGTAAAVGGFARAMLDALAGRHPDWLGAAEAGLLVQPRPGGSLRTGFDGKAEQGSSAGARFGPSSFGHLGFTGTSVWCDPAASLAVVLLTNRVHPSRENVRIRDVRPDIHGQLFGLAAGL
ncbi:MAG TPA: serine hydrolase domain-containing protein [Polyangiaceae bacterium]|nr:serine hydrolase domain-containing protein [Polyangiaceae bacterium]